MRKYFSALSFFGVMALSIDVVSEEFPYSNIEAIHSSELVLIGNIQFTGETYKSLEGYELPRPMSGENGSVTMIEFVVKNNLGDDTYKVGERLRVEIPQAQLEKFTSAPNGGLLAQSSDVLLGFDVLQTNDKGVPLKFGVRTEEYVISNSNEQELRNWLDSIRGADTPTLNKLMAAEWIQKGLDGASFKQKLDAQYQERLNKPVVERDSEFAAAEEAMMRASHLEKDAASLDLNDSAQKAHINYSSEIEPSKSLSVVIPENKSVLEKAADDSNQLFSNSHYMVLFILGVLGILLLAGKVFFTRKLK